MTENHGLVASNIKRNEILDGTKQKVGCITIIFFGIVTGNKGNMFK